MLTQINRSLKNKLLLDCITQQKQSRNINTLIFDVCLEEDTTWFLKN